MGHDYYLCVGQGKKETFSLPPNWVATHFLESETGEILSSAGQMATDALDHPAGRGLDELLAPGKGKKIAVIVDDGTRPTPVREILEILLARIEGAGFSRENIAIVIALGTHGRMNGEALETKLGRDVVSRYPVVQHDAWGKDLVPVRVPGYETPARINPAVAQAEVKIGISSVLPHPMAGYGGGPKILMPGVCDADFLTRHHMSQTIHPLSRAGLAKGNPFHEACMKIAQTIGLDFSINCVYNKEGQLARIVAGGLQDAYSRAVEVCLEKLGHRFDEKVDVTITSTYPHTHGIQFCKGLAAPDAITRDAGAVLVVAPLVTPLLKDFLGAFGAIREKSHDRSKPYVTGIMSEGRLFLPDNSPEFNMAVYSIVRRPAIRTIIVSPLISPDDASSMGMEHAVSVEEGLRILERSYPRAEVAIFPSGGLVVPITAWEQ
ncbi:MAG: hypothetical protein A4E57_03179 [Syntrophorhabdaceae bacterium PtaU1.Bin034]|nr:MAG: hypothetical protein A4E57_03179 [Syntrophorhabdaceae bacterium PtaU1.Bin034]